MRYGIFLLLLVIVSPTPRIIESGKTPRSHVSYLKIRILIESRKNVLKYKKKELLTRTLRHGRRV